MKTLTNDLKSHIQQDTTSLCSCVKITRRDGTVLGMTDLDQDINYASVLYKAYAGYKRSAVETGDSFQVDNMTIEGILNSDHISAADVRKGLFDYAEVSVFLLNYNDLSMGEIPLRTGWMGEVITNQKGTFTTEVRGLTQTLHTVFGDVYESSCDADLGDSRCKVDLTGFTWSGHITQIDSGTRVFRANTVIFTDGYFNYGGLKFTTGANAGRLLEIKNYVNATRQFEMFLSFPFPLELGDVFDVYPGCDKIITTCYAKFNNVLNFRGEPYIPGMDQANQYANLQSASGSNTGSLGSALAG